MNKNDMKTEDMENYYEQKMKFSKSINIQKEISNYQKKEHVKSNFISIILFTFIWYNSQRH